jgi:hypothetical protein
LREIRREDWNKRGASEEGVNTNFPIRLTLSAFHEPRYVNASARLRVFECFSLRLDLETLIIQCHRFCGRYASCAPFERRIEEKTGIIHMQIA